MPAGAHPRPWPPSTAANEADPQRAATRHHVGELLQNSFAWVPVHGAHNTTRHVPETADARQKLPVDLYFELCLCCADTPGCCMRAATPEERQALYRLGAVQPRAHSANLVSLATAVSALRRLKASDTLIGRLETLEQAQQAPSAAGPGGSTNMISPTLAPPQPAALPTGLPVCSVPADKLHKRCGLLTVCPRALTDPSLSGQLRAFTDWSTAPVQLNRQGYGPVSTRTLENQMEHIYLFLGYAYQHLGYRQPMLDSFANCDALACYASFMLAKKASINTMSNNLSTARKVAQWLRAHAEPSRAAELKGVLSWMEDLKLNLVRAVPRKRKDPVTLQEQAQWASAAEVLQLVNMLAEASQSPAVQQNHTPANARTVHDACLLACMFGYMPPLRLFCLRTLALPSHPLPPQGRCLDPDCSDEQCLGNRLMFVGKQLKVHLSHHKNVKRWNGLPITFHMPSELLELLQPHFEWAHALCAEDPDEPHVFLHKSGCPFKSASQLTTAFHALMKQLGSAAHFPPTQLRHIFVDERRGRDRVEGPDDVAAAQVMGTSKAQWDKSYDLLYGRREAQAAVDAMAAWRSQLLAGRSRVPPAAAAVLQAITAGPSGSPDSDCDGSTYVDCADDSEDDASWLPCDP